MIRRKGDWCLMRWRSILYDECSNLIIKGVNSFLAYTHTHTWQVTQSIRKKNANPNIIQVVKNYDDDENKTKKMVSNMLEYNDDYICLNKQTNKQLLLTITISFIRFERMMMMMMIWDNGLLYINDQQCVCVCVWWCSRFSSWPNFHSFKWLFHIY